LTVNQITKLDFDWGDGVMFQPTSQDK